MNRHALDKPAGPGLAGYGLVSPLQRFLEQCHEEFRSDASGQVASYIPELTRAIPEHFGAAFGTIDGHVYEVGDSAARFTIQSVSKAFVFALALDVLRLSKEQDAGADVKPEDLMNVGSSLFGGAEMFKLVLTEGNIALDEMGDLVKMLLEAYTAEVAPPNPKTQA